MTIYEYATIINEPIVIEFVPENNSFVTSFKDLCEIKEGGFLRGCSGYGVSVRDSLNDFIANIVGNTLVFNAYSKNRKEFKVPDSMVRAN